MASRSFSETQFSFCYVYEILKKYPKKLMPIFPTLREEKHLGFDVKIGGSLFLQFKRPKCIANNKYQIKLAHHQFQILYSLKLNKPANKVFYVAPIFHTLQDMRNFYINGTIEKNSAHFPLENFSSSFSAKTHTLRYEYDASVLTSLHKVPLTINGVQPKGTYGILNSDPVSVGTEHKIITETDFRDEMSLAEKANFLLKVIPNDVSTMYKDKYRNEVDKLYSILLVEYNILWIPIL